MPDSSGGTTKSPKLKKKAKDESEDDSFVEDDMMDENEDNDYNGDSDFDDDVEKPSTKKQKLMKSESKKLTKKEKTQKDGVKKIKKDPIPKSPKKAGSRSSVKVKEDPEEKKKKKLEFKSEEDVYAWWKESGKEKENPTWKWDTLEHNGVAFPPLYTPHGVKMKYDGKEVDLTPEQEEYATFYAKYANNPKYQKPHFKKNFFKDFLKILNPNPKGPKHVIQKFELCDFSPIVNYLEEMSLRKKNRTKEEKAKENEERLAIKEKYGYAIVDGRKEPLGNFVVEPPGLFLGRGEHPKSGRVKKRIYPEDITLNIAENAKIPECPLPGHNWGKIIHNHEVSWVASWTENISGGIKYVLFGQDSSIRGQSDKKKFEVARQLQTKIDEIRSNYLKHLTDENMLNRQRATALWVIDNLALRVGNEKKKDEADTVGCCSLRVEHIKLLAPNKIEFDFLGKDSMRYYNVVEVTKQVFQNFKLFTKGKKKSDLLFDQLTPTSLNNFLKSQMPGLTAKVFRTYNASITLKNQLSKFDPSVHTTPEEKVLFFNRANREVAILCNHQRTVSTAFSSQMEKLDEKIKEIEREKQILLEHYEKMVGNPKKRKRDQMTGEEDSKEPLSSNGKPIKIPKTAEGILKKIKILESRIAKCELRKTEKEDLKEVALSTSKNNYIDPRIAVAWCRNHDVDIKKIFSKQLRRKFSWAIEEADEDFDW